MSGLILCTKKTDIPYRISDANLNIYSIEELAYYLYNNAYFVDESFFSEELISYIEDKLNLKKIAQRLRYAIGQKIDFYELVMIIITGAKYYSENEIRGFEKELKSIGTKSMLERMKARAEMLYKNGKLSSAMQVYDNILSNRTYKKQSEEFYSDVYFGRARIHCRMFYFKEAIEELNEAYRLNNTLEILKSLIYAKLLYEKTFGIEADFTDELENNSEIVFSCKQELKDLETQLLNGSEYERLSKIFIYDGKRNLDDYYEGIQNILDNWKEEYKANFL